MAAPRQQPEVITIDSSPEPEQVDAVIDDTLDQPYSARQVSPNPLLRIVSFSVHLRIPYKESVRTDVFL